MNDLIRIGFISTVDAKNGMAQVYYPEQGNTTAYLHLFSMNGEYQPPEIGAQVLVLHLPDDTSSGVILGKFWNSEALPQTDAEYKKELGAGAFVEWKKGTYKIRADEILFEGSAGTMTLSEIIRLRERVERLEAEGE